MRWLPYLFCVIMVLVLFSCQTVDTDDYYTEGNNDSSHLSYISEDKNPIKALRAIGLFERHSLVPIADVLDLTAPLYGEIITRKTDRPMQLLMAWQFKDQVFLALLDSTQVRFIYDPVGETPEVRFQFIMRHEFSLYTTDTGLYRLLANSDQYIRHAAIHGSSKQFGDSRYIRLVP